MTKWSKKLIANLWCLYDSSASFEDSHEGRENLLFMNSFLPTGRNNRISFMAFSTRIWRHLKRKISNRWCCCGCCGCCCCCCCGFKTRINYRLINLTLKIVDVGKFCCMTDAGDAVDVTNGDVVVNDASQQKIVLDCSKRTIRGDLKSRIGSSCKKTIIIRARDLMS